MNNSYHNSPNPSGNPLSSGNMYSQSATGNAKRTIIAGMGKCQNGQPKSNQAINALEEGRFSRIYVQDRALAGILYSVSRTSKGEIFPLYTGRNTIGSSPDSDIYLPEDTVSPNHSILLIRILHRGDNDEIGLTMNITDYDSDFGTKVNGEVASLDPVALTGQEIIQIGNAYQFLFIPLIPQKHGLREASRFIALPRMDLAEKEVEFPMNPIQYHYHSVETISKEEAYPNAVSAEDESTFYGRSYRKKEDHSGNKTIL